MVLKYGSIDLFKDLVSINTATTAEVAKVATVAAVAATATVTAATTTSKSLVAGSVSSALPLVPEVGSLDKVLAWSDIAAQGRTANKSALFDGMNRSIEGWVNKSKNGRIGKISKT